MAQSPSPSPFPTAFRAAAAPSGETWQSVGGRGFRLDPASTLARSEWLAVGEVAGHASGARILSAAAIDERDVLALFAKRIETRHDGAFDPATGKRHAHSKPPPRRDPLVEPAPIPRPTRKRSSGRSLEGVLEHGLALLPGTNARSSSATAPLSRTRFDPAIAELDDAMLMDRAEQWLAPLLSGKRRLGDIAPAAHRDALEQLIGYPGSRKLDRLAPAEFVSPAGSRHPIDYSADAGPTVEVRAQALFGLLGPPDGRERRGPAHPRHHLARRAADPDHQGPARLLGRKLARRRQGHARALPQAFVARRPGLGRADAPDQARVLGLHRHHQMRVRGSRPHHIRHRSVRFRPGGCPLRISFEPTTITCGPVLIQSLSAVGLVA